MNINIGNINKMFVFKKTSFGYTLRNEFNEEAFLDIKENDSLELADEVNVFVFLDADKKIMASLNTPNITNDTFNFVKVVNVIDNLGVFIDNNTSKDPLISCDDLPLDKSVWPQVGDTILAKLKITKGNMIAKLVTSEEAKTYYRNPRKLDKFKKIEATVIKNGKEGTNMVSDEGHIIFVYYKHRRRDYHIGEKCTVTITNVCLDGTYNGTLLPSKLNLMKDDALVILDYLTDNDGVMEYTANTDVETIERVFKMSKAAFKRALGNLYKDREIEFKDGKTYLLK